MVQAAETRKRIVDAALDLAVAVGWPAVTLSRIATHSGLPIREVQRHTPNHAEVLAAITAEIDEAVMEEGPADADETARDRLFEIMMRRFDALQERRVGMLAVIEAVRREPLSAACQWHRLRNSMRLMLDLADLPARGLFGEAKAQLLTGIWVDLLRTWRSDDSEDLARTMKALDQRIGQAERLANSLGTRRSKAPAKPPGGEEEAGAAPG